MAATSKISLKLLIDKKSNKVLFAEAGKDFVDFLFSLLSLPVGTVIRLLKTPSMVGCVGNLYDSLQKLDEAYMQPHQTKDSLLNPNKITNISNLHLLSDHIHEQPAVTERRFYACASYNHRCVSDRRGARCSYCGSSMNHETVFVAGINVSSADNATASSSEGGYVKGLVTYMVTDDLEVSPMSMVSGIALFNKSSVKGFGALDGKRVNFGIKEGLELLKASLWSKEALTTVFLAKHEAQDGAAAPN